MGDKTSGFFTGIDLWDERSLCWYYSHGIARFERSTFGVTLDRQQDQTLASRPCKKCHRTGVLNSPWVRTKDHNEDPLPEPQHLESGQECPNCMGVGHVSAKRGNRKAPRHGYRRCHACKGAGQQYYFCSPTGKMESSGECVDCSGEGYTFNGAAFSSGVEVHTASTVAAYDMARFGIVGRMISRVRARSPICAVALELFYGDIGAFWGRTMHGRIFSLYLLTPAGRKLMRLTERNDSKSPLERLSALANENAADVDGPHRELFLQASTMASAIWTQMCVVWQAIKAERNEAEQKTE